ncbi:MAG: hypothetical protein CM1200mP14_14610 [Gammaproteobacteria bacterium]|nr:MAG: hypothetical protein CM1200mP14_14610 [Gammaproteobacteria bacterium]
MRFITSMSVQNPQTFSTASGLARRYGFDQTTPVVRWQLRRGAPWLERITEGGHLYMTTAHGVPDGKLWKFHAGPTL